MLRTSSSLPVIFPPTPPHFLPSPRPSTHFFPFYTSSSLTLLHPLDPNLPPHTPPLPTLSTSHLPSLYIPSSTPPAPYTLRLDSIPAPRPSSCPPAPFRIGLGYHEFSSVRPSKEYVSAVCYAPSSDLYPNGYILTGCKDGTMKAFELTSTSEQIFTVKHHSDNCKYPSTFEMLISYLLIAKL